MVAIFPLNTTFDVFSDDAKRSAKLIDTTPYLPPAREDDIGDAVGVFKQRTDLGLREASDATADLRDEERQFWMVLRKRDKLIDIGRDGLYPTLHRRDAVTLSLKAYTLTPDGAKLAISQERSPATM